jgi:hypothetical protein
MIENYDLEYFHAIYASGFMFESEGIFSIFLMAL